MKKETAELPTGVQRQIRVLEALPGDEIDTTDAPEILDWSDGLASGVSQHHTTADKTGFFEKFMCKVLT